MKENRFKEKGQPANKEPTIEGDTLFDEKLNLINQKIELLNSKEKLIKENFGKDNKCKVDDTNV